MKMPALTAALFAAALFAGGAATAQTAPAKPTKPAKVVKAKKQTEAQAAPVAAAPTVLPPANQEQLEAAERTLFGGYDCDFDQKVEITHSTRAPGYVDIKFKNSIFTMKPILSSTGALRLEDVSGRTLMLQIANKSMLMDTKLGQRMVDNCIHPEQAKFNAARS